jgi:hypothetical protein
MNARYLRRSGASGIILLGSGLALAFEPASAQAPSSNEPGQLDTGTLVAARGIAPEAELGSAPSGGAVAKDDRLAAAVGLRSQTPNSPDVVPALSKRPPQDISAEQLERTGSAAPIVKARAGDHGDFERIVFEWPEAIEHYVAQQAEQVTVAFGQPGRIDLSRVRHDIGPRVMEAWSEGGDVTSRVVLRLSPGATIDSFSLEDGRIVVIDVFGAMAAQTPVRAAPDPVQDSVEELKRALEQRDAVIESLLVRVEQLERNVALSRGDLDRIIAGGAGAAPAVGNRPDPQPGSQVAAAAEERSAPEPSPARSDPAESQRQAAPVSQDQGAGQQEDPERRETAQTEAPAPGQFEVDEEAAERALDFTLVEEGALLLPLGRAQVTPSFTYTRETGDFPVVVNPGSANPLLGEEDVRRNEFEFAADLLVGLPLDSQLELGLPYNLVDESTVNRVRGSAVQESSRTGEGLGDFSVGLAKTVLRERNWLPDVVLRVNWDTGTGERQNNDVFLDAGFQELTGSVSLIKRQDPLVFVGGGFYEWAYDQEDDVDPGNSYGFNIGTFLAASPNTSLNVVLNQSFGDEVEVAGQRIRGSDTVQSILTFGASAILTRNMLLNGAVGVGLTDDSPDYSVSLSLPIRFNTPGL